MIADDQGVGKKAGDPYAYHDWHPERGNQLCGESQTYSHHEGNLGHATGVHPAVTHVDILNRYFFLVVRVHLW